MSAIPWYGPALIFVSIMIFIAVVCWLGFHCKTDPPLVQENRGYTELATEEIDHEIKQCNIKSVESLRFDILSELHKDQIDSDENVDDVIVDKMPDSDMEDSTSDTPLSQAEAIQHSVVLVNETAAETSVSDTDTEHPENVSISAYGDMPGGSLMTNVLSHGNTRMQVSIIYSEERKYVAGKITQLDAIPTRDEKGPDQVKVHVVLLPGRKYILKTRYYYVNKKCKFDEYFKLKFRNVPEQEVTSLRFRVYGRRLKIGVPGREKCIGETVVRLVEIAQSPGGITIWRKMVPKRTDFSKYISISE